MSYTHEVALALSWLIPTLSGDSTLSTAAPGGVWRADAPPGTTTPYVAVILQQGATRDGVVFGGGRAFADLCFHVFAAGPAASTAGIATAAGRLDALLTVAQPTAITGGTLIASYRIAPLEADVLLDGNLWTNIGGEYRVLCKSS